MASSKVFWMTLIIN